MRSFEKFVLWEIAGAHHFSIDVIRSERMSMLTVSAESTSSAARILWNFFRFMLNNYFFQGLDRCFNLVITSAEVGALANACSNFSNASGSRVKTLRSWDELVGWFDILSCYCVCTLESSLPMAISAALFAYGPSSALSGTFSHAKGHGRRR